MSLLNIFKRNSNSGYKYCKNGFVAERVSLLEPSNTTPVGCEYDSDLQFGFNSAFGGNDDDRCENGDTNIIVNNDTPKSRAYVEKTDISTTSLPMISDLSHNQQLRTHENAVKNSMFEHGYQEIKLICNVECIFITVTNPQTYMFLVFTLWSYQFYSSTAYNNLFILIYCALDGKRSHKQLFSIF